MNIFVSGTINKKKKSWQKFLIGFLVLGIFIFILNIFSFQIKNYFLTLSLPVQKTFSSAGKSSSNWFGSFLNSTNLYEKNKELEKENQKLLSQISILQSIQEGNRALSAISATCQDSNFETIMAGVTGLDNQDILTLNKGSDDGIATGMPVINEYNVLYGKIFKVYKNFSQVMLISNKNSVVNAQVQKNDSEGPVINGVIKGNGGLSIYLDLVPVDTQINSKEILITSPLEEIFPKNILVGEITNIEKNDQKPFQKAQINPFFDIDNMENLFVITNYKR
jgi:rod shape-determining protein MreC